MKICIVIPMYNEEKRFKIDELISFKSLNQIDFFLINDGSTDNTEALIQKSASENNHVYAFSYNKNKGKAEAIRHGALEALKNKDYVCVGYLDADLATPLSEIDNLIHVISNLNKKFVMGSRIKRLGSNIKRFKIRHISGRIIATIISELILKLDVYDTQCGAKLISRDIASSIFSEPFISKWLFDVELIFRIKKKHGSTFSKNEIYELPLNNWEDIGQSKITFLDLLDIPTQLFKIHRHYR